MGTGEGETAAVWKHDSARALAAGLRCRPVAESIRDTAAWLFGPGAWTRRSAPTAPSTR
ncbi:hypothetical protein NKH77_54365 [Streptomyces sp. M19]